MEFIRNFTQIDKNDAALAGGKGASLGEMTRADIPVPPGFVILAEAFEKFLEEAHLKAEIEAKLAAVKHEEIHTIENASGQIQALVMAAKMPNDMTSEIHTHFKKLNTPYVAVRSSATAEDSAAAAWAGQLDTFLNTSETELLDNVKKCWASLFTPRAIFYRFEKGLHTTEISVAVVVQKMVESEISGIAFSVHPVTEDYNQMIIEAGLGLGEAIVSGQITPDSYVMEKQPRRIIDTQIATQTRGLYRSESGGNSWLDIAEEIGAKQVLSDEQILELAALILKIENHYGFPVDVEWAFEKNAFYIVQSRPITTLAGITGQNDNLPEFFSHLKKFATRPMTVQRDEIGGIMWSAYHGRFVSIPLDAHNRATYIENSDAERVYQEIFQDFTSTLKWKKHLKKYAATVAILKKLARACTQNKNKTPRQLLTVYRQWLQVIHHFSTYIIAPFPVEYLVDPQCRELLQIEVGQDIEKYFAIISSPSKLNEFQKMRLGILNGAIDGKVRTRSKTLEKKYAWYSEYSFVEPLLDEKFFAAEIKKLSADEAKKEKQKMLSEIKNNKTAFASFIKKIKNPKLRLCAEVLHTYTFLRTDRIDQLKRAQIGIRRIFDIIAAQLKKKTGHPWTRAMVVHCLSQELIDFLEKGWIPNIEDIKKRISGHYIYYIEAGQAHIFYDKEKIKKTKKIIEADESNDTNIRGTIAFAGKVVGRVAVVSGKIDLSKVQPGDVLVAKTTMPDYAPAMQRAVAFVTEEGGITSHAAIIARELKKPCIVATGNCTKILKDGDLVEVDADQGTVHLLSGLPNRAKPTFKKEEYLLSFWVKGVSVFVTDLHRDVYRELEVLYIIDRGVFKQYFTKRAYAQALERGLKFYSDEHAFGEYQKDLTQHSEKCRHFFETEIQNHKKLSPETVQTFFAYTKKLCGDYAKMNFEFTDKAFAHQEHNPTIKKNLSSVAEFKDSIRSIMNLVLFESDGYTNQLFKILSTQFGVSSVLLDNLTQAEILDLFTGKKPNEAAALRRQQAFVESYDRPGFSEGEEAESIINEFREKPSPSKIIQGQAANGGKVRGKVKIIPVDYSDLARVNTEIAKMETGNILVAETTAPELILACQKAAAIVTDMGGLMSHAAIVSRESGIPCVVDTKNATQILKDGDMVEVDARAGTVEIIQK